MRSTSPSASIQNRRHPSSRTDICKADHMKPYNAVGFPDKQEIAIRAAAQVYLRIVVANKHRETMKACTPTAQV